MTFSLRDKIDVGHDTCTYFTRQYRHPSKEIDDFDVTQKYNGAVYCITVYIYLISIVTKKLQIQILGILVFFIKKTFKNPDFRLTVTAENCCLLV